MRMRPLGAKCQLAGAGGLLGVMCVGALLGLSERRGESAAPPRRSALTATDYAQHVLALKRRLPRDFSVELVPPFVVVGDGGQDQVQKYAGGTVSWALKRLKESYFTRDPDEIVDIWLFKDAASYNGHLQSLFNERPHTPYGYYSVKHRALFMNIGTGGGTLVHELVHPYVHANFPDAPAWLNEGLGSLYEQCSEADGRIVGLTNWRLAGLQQAIQAHRLPAFRALAEADEDDFYEGRHQNTGYAQARYLLYYLQEKGLLTEFYRRFYDARKTDPSGYQTLQALLGESDMAAFQRRWERWVLGLVFRG